jgi:hypothetical protein
MSTPVLYREPAHHEPAPAYPTRTQRGATLAELLSARPGQLVTARAEALFASDLSAQCEHTETEVAAAIKHAIRTHHGLRGCAGEVAAAYGERPETAARRMRWARAVVEDMYGGPPASGVNVTAAVPATAGTARPVNPGRADTGHGAAGCGAGRRPSLAEQGYVHASFGGVPVLVGPELAGQLKATRNKQS